MSAFPSPFLETRPDADQGELFDWARAKVSHAAAQDIYRQREGRTTLRFDTGGQAYFLKYHAGVGWREIVRNLLRLRLPVSV